MMTFSRRLKSAALIAVFVFAPLAAQAQERYALKPNLTKGSNYHYRTHMSMDNNVQGQPMQIEMGMEFDMDVISVLDGIRTIQTSTDRYRMSISAGEMQFLIDSKEKEPSISEVKENPMLIMQKMFNNVVGKSYTIKMDADGKIVYFDGYEELIKEAIKSIAWDDEIRAAIEQEVQGKFSDEQMRTTMEQGFQFYPDQPVAVGESWTKQVAIEGLADATTDTKYTLMSVANGKAEIEVSGDYVMAIEGMRLQGTQHGTMTLDLESGMTENMDMKLSAQGLRDGVPASMKIEMKTIGKFSPKL